MKRLAVLVFLLWSALSWAGGWVYDQREDKMGGTIYSADILSKNTVSFDFPYQGEQRATLGIRKHPRWGTSVMISIRRGQFVCRLSDCSLMVRFDERKATRFAASEPADGSSDLLFFDRDISADIRKASVLRVEAVFYQEGARAFEFDVSGLVWPPSGATGKK